MPETDFIAVKSIQGLSAGKRDIFFQFNSISRLQRYSLRDDCEEVIPQFSAFG